MPIFTIMEEVIIVNEKDEQAGTLEKMEAHLQGRLHRAFSIFIFNDKNEMLLQKRADSKYHSGGLWTNACCSHPRPGETTIDAANRRLREEMGFNTKIEKAFDFIYEAPFENGLTEHEFDHVFIGHYNGPITANLAEVQDHIYLPMSTIESMIASSPKQYTAWFCIAFPMLKKWLADLKK